MNNGNHLNLTLLSNEMRLLLSLLNDNCNNEILEGLENDIDWKQFIKLTKHHRVYPNVYQRLKSLKSYHVPEQVLQQLYIDYKKNTFQMLYLSGEMEQLAGLFKENEIRAMFLKGPILADNLYGDISQRTSGDLDILVSIDDLDRIDNHLSTVGYVKDDYIHTILGDWKWRHHHFTYYHPIKKIKVEIHWRLNPGPSKEPGFDELWGRKRLCEMTTTPIYILSQADLFLFLVLHGARHGWSRARWLLDIKQMLNQSPDWIKTLSLLRKYHCLHVAGQTLILTSQLLGKSPPVELAPLTYKKISQCLAEDAMFYFRYLVNLHSEPVPDEVSEYHSKYLIRLMPLRQKILFRLSLLFPYPEDAEVLPLPKQFHFLYFPLRPFLWMWRRSRRVVPEEAKR